MNVKKFLEEFADKFGKSEEEKKIILNSDEFHIDYLDGVFDFCNSKELEEWRVLDSLEFSKAFENIDKDKLSELKQLLKDLGVGKTAPLYYLGGDNSHVIACEDYRFLWDNLISEQTDFMAWMKKHDITEKDIMYMEGHFYGEDSVVLECNFYFYDIKSDLEYNFTESDVYLMSVEDEPPKYKEEKGKDFYYSQIDGVGKIFFDNVTNNVTTLNG